MKKSSIAFAAAALTASLFTASAMAADLSSLDPVNLTIYSPGNENAVPTKTIIKYAELVEEASNGQITFDVHHSGELGNDAEALMSTRMGTIDVIFAGTSGFTEFYENAKILDLPFLFDSAEEAYEVVNGEIGEEIFADRVAEVGDALCAQTALQVVCVARVAEGGGGRVH